MVSNFPTVAIHTIAGATDRLLAFRGRHSAICQRALPDMPQPADFGGFYYDLASNLLAYRAVME
jgi:hypothetical protein